jgi:hypothetical protein
LKLSRRSDSTMSENPYEAALPKIPSRQEERDEPPLSPRAKTWRGAKRAARIAAWLAGPFASLLIIPALAVTAFGLGSGRGFAVSSYVLAGLATFLFFTTLGGIIGGTAALIGALIGRRRTVAASAPDSSADQLIPAKGTPRPPVGFKKARRQRRLWPWFVGIPLLLILAAAGVVGAYVGRLVDRKLAAAIAAADQDDPHWRLDDLLAHRQEVPDSLNSAPVMDEILTLIPAGWPSSRIATPGAPDSARERLKVDYQTLETTPTNFRPSDSVAETLRGELKTHEKAVLLARSLVKYPRGRHELTIGPAVFDTDSPHVQGVRGVARLLVADAAMRAQDGDLSGALDSCRAIFAAARSIGDEPFLISHIVHISIGEAALNTTWRALGQGEASDAALARLQDLILDEMKQPLLVTGVKGERAVLTEVIRRLGSGEIPISALSNGRTSDRFDSPGALAPWGKLWFDYQQAVALERMTEAVAIARRSIGDRPALWRAWEAEAERRKRSPITAYSEMLPLMLAPAVVTASSAFSRYQTDLAASAILVAAERHRRKAGHWPESVAAIDKTILPSAPADPFTGKSFRMEHHDGQLFVYSIGPNGVDEAGAYDPRTWMLGQEDDVGAQLWDVSQRGRTAAPEPEIDGDDSR